MIHALEIGLALGLGAVLAGLVAQTVRPKPTPVRVRANRSRRQA